MKRERIRKVVLAYSGGLDTSVMLRWLIDNYKCEVVAFCADLGQGEDLEEVREKAERTGASKVYIDDLKEEFVRDFVFPAFRANAVYEAGYLLGTSLARPLIAKRQVEIAKAEGADAVAHGATGKGNDQVRFELTYQALDPDLKIIAPWREWEFKSRQALIEYAEAQNIQVSATTERPYSIDRNLLHSSYEGGVLEDPWREPEEGIFLLSVSPQKAPDEPEYVEIDFAEGNPVGIGGKQLSPARLLAALNEIASRHGVGRVDMVENRYVGIKVRGVYETPGGTIMQLAHRAVESITIDREVMHLKEGLVPKYSELVYYGYWFSPERDFLQSAIDASQREVSGTARLKLFKGSCAVVGRKSDKSLYRPDYATFEEESVYNPKDAEGFIRINALRLRIRGKTGETY